MISLVRRVDAPRWLGVAVSVGSVLAALVAGALLLVVTGNDPLTTYEDIIVAAFSDLDSWSATIVAATPLIFTGLAAAAAFRMGVFNIGGEGQLVLGAVAATAVGLAYGESLGWWSIGLMIVAGAVAGGALAFIPGVLKAKFNTSEIITSLMLNYIALNFASHLIFNSTSYWRELEGSGRQFPQGKKLPDGAEWPVVELGQLELPFGFLLALVVAAGVAVLYRSTRFGFEVRAIAGARDAAKAAGMRTSRKIMAVMALSGALAGLGGASDVGDFRHVLDPKGLQQSGFGYAGIVVAALARTNAAAVVPIAMLMGGLDNAGRALQGPDFPSGLVGTLQGMILFFALGGEVLSRYRVARR